MDSDSVLIAAATVAGSMMRDHSAPPVEIARRAWEVTAALITEGQARGYAGAPAQFAELTQAAQQGFAGAGLPDPAQQPEVETPRRQRTGSARTA